MESESADEYEVPKFNNYSEIISLYREHILGNIKNSPSHAGPLEVESGKLISNLLILNSAQILTIDSQPGALEFVENNETTTIQRAYLHCYMNLDQYEKLMDSLLLTELLVFITKAIIKDQDENITVRIPVTVGSVIEDNQKIDSIFTQIPIGNMYELEIMFMNTDIEIRDEILEDLYLVQILDPIWNRPTYLFDIVSQIFQ
jgi:hypothetical protein